MSTVFATLPNDLKGEVISHLTVNHEAQKAVMNELNECCKEARRRKYFFLQGGKQKYFAERGWQYPDDEVKLHPLYMADSYPDIDFDESWTPAVDIEPWVYVGDKWEGAYMIPLHWLDEC